jgi:hypothetical protein
MYKGYVVLIGGHRPPDSSLNSKFPYWVKLPNGNMFIRKIKPGFDRGRFHLIHPLTMDVMENMEIESVAEIKATIPNYK